MANESINLNLIPTGEMPVIHVSQFDNGRAFNVNLLKGSDDYNLPEGYTAELHCRKADRNIVTIATTNISSNTLTFTTTTQLCACAGDNLCEIAIKDNEDYLVGSLNFILQVEKDPLQGGIQSTSEIYDLTDQIEDITTEIVGENYYTKTETDTLLDAKANAADVYTKTQVDTALSSKANAADVYTKTQVDTALSSKANAADVYTKTQVDTALSAKANTADLATVATTGDYDDLLNKPTIPAAQVQSDYAQNDNTKVDYIKNRPDIYGMIAAAIYDIMPESTVTGAVASFNTDLEKPLTALTVGSGATKILQCGGNSTIGEYIKKIYDGTHGFVDLGSLDYVYTDGGFTSQLPENSKVLDTNADVLDCYCGIYEIMSWNDANYYTQSGTMGTGILHYIKIYDSAYSDATAFKAAMNNHYLIYELETPVTPSITDTQFETLCNSFESDSDVYTLPVSTNPTTYNGDNNFFTDNGNITVSYKESIQHYVDRKAGT